MDRTRGSAHKNKLNVAEAPKIKRMADHDKPGVNVDRTTGMARSNGPGVDAVKISSATVNEADVELDKTGESAKESMSQPNGKVEKTRGSDTVSVPKPSSEVDRAQSSVHIKKQGFEVYKNRGTELDIVDTTRSPKNAKLPTEDEVGIRSSALTNKQTEMHRKRGSVDRNDPSVEVIGPTAPMDKPAGDWASGSADVKKSGIDRGRSSVSSLGQGVLSSGTNSIPGSPSNRKSADEDGQGIDRIQSFPGGSNMHYFLQNRMRPTNTFGSLHDRNQRDVLSDRRPINVIGGSADSNKPQLSIRRRTTNLFGTTAVSNARNNFSNKKPTHSFGSSVDTYSPRAPSNRWRLWTPKKDFNVESNLRKTPGFGTRTPHYFGSSVESNKNDVFPSRPTHHFPNSSSDSYKPGFLPNMRRPRQHFNRDLAKGHQNHALGNTRSWTRHPDPGSADKFTAYGKTPSLLNRPRRTHLYGSSAGMSHLFGSTVNRNRPVHLLGTRPTDNFNGSIYAGKPIDVPNTRKPSHHSFSEGSTFNNKPSDLSNRTRPTNFFLRDSNDWRKNENISDRLRTKQFRWAPKNKPYIGVAPNVTGPMNNADGNKPGVQADRTKSSAEIKTNLPAGSMVFR